MRAGTDILLFREYGDWTFMSGNQYGANKRTGVELTIQHANDMEWYDIQDPVNGSPADFERGDDPVPGLFINIL